MDRPSYAFLSYSGTRVGKMSWIRPSRGYHDGFLEIRGRGYRDTHRHDIHTRMYILYLLLPHTHLNFLLCISTPERRSPKEKTHNYVGTALGGFPTSCFCKRGPTGCLNLLPPVDIWTLDAVTRTRICVNAVYQGGLRWRGWNIDDVSFVAVPGSEGGSAVAPPSHIRLV